MRTDVILGGHINLMNVSVTEDYFQEVVWRALLILKRENPDFHFEVYSEGKKITNGGDVLRVGKEG
jgi:hypothetical protein